MRPSFGDFIHALINAHSSPPTKSKQTQQPSFFFKGTGKPAVGHGINLQFLGGRTPIPTPQARTNLQQLPDFTTSRTPYYTPNKSDTYTGPAVFGPGGRPMPPTIQV